MNRPHPTATASVPIMRQINALERECRRRATDLTTTAAEDELISGAVDTLRMQSRSFEALVDAYHIMSTVLARSPEDVQAIEEWCERNGYNPLTGEIK